jgi:hypothetical protein
MDRFTGPTVGGEWLVGLGNYFEAGAGLGFYQRTVPAADRLGRVNNATGNPIVADLKLRIAPFTATVRALPLGHDAPIVPYVGAGVGVYAWRYSESGEFVDFVDNKTIFAGTFVGSGAAVGPVVLAGVRVPIGPMAPGFEVRWQKAQGNLPGLPDFEPGRVIDLGGLNYLFTFNIKF